MSRPDERPLRRLPQLASRREALEKCVFCPKLCRSACPVSNAEPRETLTPWGKMSLAYFGANESVPAEPSYAAPAWACTGCFGCRDRCDHKNDVAGTLFDARSAWVSAGQAPPAAERTLRTFARHEEALAASVRALGDQPEVDDTSGTAVLVGCAYVKNLTAESRDAIAAAAALTSERVQLVSLCCGAPLLHAGDKKRFVQQGEMLAQAVKHARRLVVVDPGCAATIKVHHAAAGVTMPVEVELLVELAARALTKLTPRSAGLTGDVRWHDPCQLGRGLGVYDAPRAVLSRTLGRAPEEFPRRLDDARCSGAGGLLPLTMPDVSRTMAQDRLAEHTRAGGGTLVTGCASSLRRFRSEGEAAVDIVSLIARALKVAHHE